MMSAVVDMAKFADDRLFEEISEGISYIVENALSFDHTARRLCQAQEYRAAEILRGFAEEEAAKVLILIDAVRELAEMLSEIHATDIILNRPCARAFPCEFAPERGQSSGRHYRMNGLGPAA